MKNWQWVIDRVLSKYVGGHIRIGPVVIHGWNAMRISISVRTRWGSVCFHPTIRVLGYDCPWYFYISPNGTPWASTFAIGPGVEPVQKAMAPLRRYLFGHNFSTDGGFVDWNVDYRNHLESIRWENVEKQLVS